MSGNSLESDICNSSWCCLSLHMKVGTHARCRYHWGIEHGPWNKLNLHEKGGGMAHGSEHGYPLSCEVMVSGIFLGLKIGFYRGSSFPISQSIDLSIWEFVLDIWQWNYWNVEDESPEETLKETLEADTWRFFKKNWHLNEKKGSEPLCFHIAWYWYIEL